MKTIGLPATYYYIRRATLVWIGAAAIFVYIAVPTANSQSRLTNTISVDVPFETHAPWWNRDRTAVEDEVLLRGTLHVTGKVWSSSLTHIDRITFHINVVDIHGTSDRTGQRYRLHGTYDLDRQDPDIPVKPDGTFVLPLDDIHLSLRKVDPEPSMLQSDMNPRGNANWSTHAENGGAPIPCTGQTGWVDCGNFEFLVFLPPVPYADRVLALSGPACVPVPCEVPDGAILFNGFTGDYNPPLLMQAHIWVDMGFISDVRLQWHCNTGYWEAPVFAVAGGEYQGCRPLYSSTEPITVWADVLYTVLVDTGFNSGFQPFTFVVSGKRHTFHMLERPAGQPPVIDPASFSVKASSGPSQGLAARCLPNVPCTVFNGDTLFNGTRGDFVPPLYMRLNASDPDGDPISVRWYCRTGNIDYAVVRDLGGGLYACDPVRSYYDQPVSIYAVVSDGTHSVTSEVRTLLMPGRFNPN